MENTDDPPKPVLNNLYLTEISGLVKINLTTIDSADPEDYYTKSVVLLYIHNYVIFAQCYCSDYYNKILFAMIHFHFSASFVLEPAYGEIESISFNNPDPPGITITSYNHSIVSLHIMYEYICTYIH